MGYHGLGSINVMESFWSGEQGDLPCFRAKRPDLKKTQGGPWHGFQVKGRAE